MSSGKAHISAAHSVKQQTIGVVSLVITPVLGGNLFRGGSAPTEVAYNT
jgi:hypothetical protein